MTDHSTCRIQVRAAPECCAQLDELSETLHISRGAVVAQAIARMYLTEKEVLKRKRKKRRRNGAKRTASSEIDQRVKGLISGSG